MDGYCTYLCAISAPLKNSLTAHLRRLPIPVFPAVELELRAFPDGNEPPPREKCQQDNDHVVDFPISEIYI